MRFTRTRDERLERASEVTREEPLGPQLCAVCGERLPRGVHRTRCVDHSEYAQHVARQLKLRRARAGQAA